MAHSSSDYFLEQYLDAVNAGREIDCYNNKIKFLERDSFMIGLTDMNILWKECIIPLYNMGDTDIPNRIHTIVNQLLETNDVVSIYCALSCIMAHYWCTAFPDCPFKIDFDDTYAAAKQAVLRNKKKFQKYDGPEFSSCVTPIWKIVSNMVGVKKYDDEYVNRPKKKPKKK